MASTQKLQSRSILISLSAQHNPPEFLFPERRIILEPDTRGMSTVKIGRTSRRDAALEAKEDNCFFDSPVMSRDHAEIRVDWFYKRVFIKDIGSMHGTYLNSDKLTPGATKNIEQGDMIKFGIDIRRSTDLFPPCTMEVHFEFDHLAKQVAQNASGQNSYKLPEGPFDSESSDDESVAEDSEILSTINKLRQIHQVRSPANDPVSREAIDLTVVENLRRNNQTVLSPANLPAPAPRPTIDLTLVDDAPSHVSTMPAHRSVPLPGTTLETIVIDEEDNDSDSVDAFDSANVTTEPIHNPPDSSQPELTKTFDMDAPHDEDEEDSQAFRQSMSPRQDLLDSDELDSDYSDEDQNPLDYPEEEMSDEELSELSELSDSDEEQAFDLSSDAMSVDDDYTAGRACESHVGEGCNKKDHSDTLVEEDGVDQCDCDSLLEEGRVDGCDCDCHGDDEDDIEEDRVVGDLDDDSEGDFSVHDAAIARPSVPYISFSFSDELDLGRQQMPDPPPQALSGAMVSGVSQSFPAEWPPLQGPQQLLRLGSTHQDFHAADSQRLPRPGSTHQDFSRVNSQTTPALDNVHLPPLTYLRGYQTDLVSQNAQPTFPNILRPNTCTNPDGRMERQSHETAEEHLFLPQNSVPSADRLGQKSGKKEFFAAREYNKAIFGSEKVEQKEPQQASSSDDEEAQLPATAEDTEMESAWAVTGKTFLNSPQSFPVSNIRESSPELDMTSAFQFQQAKLAASSSVVAKTATAEQGHDQAEEKQAEEEHHARPKSPKRKADEISTLLPEEEALETVPTQQDPEDSTMAADEAPVVVETPSPSTRTEPPPKKRFRFFPSLTACGTFGAGGLMVSSVVVGLLASTAPAL